MHVGRLDDQGVISTNGLMHLPHVAPLSRRELATLRAMDDCTRRCVLLRNWHCSRTSSIAYTRTCPSNRKPSKGTDEASMVEEKQRSDTSGWWVEACLCPILRGAWQSSCDRATHCVYSWCFSFSQIVYPREQTAAPVGRWRGLPHLQMYRCRCRCRCRRLHRCWVEMYSLC